MCYQDAAEGGGVFSIATRHAQFRLGEAYEFGDLTMAIDFEAAFTWYQKAAEGGDHDAQRRLGWADSEDEEDDEEDDEEEEDCSR